MRASGIRTSEIEPTLNFGAMGTTYPSQGWEAPFYATGMVLTRPLARSQLERADAAPPDSAFRTNARPLRASVSGESAYDRQNRESGANRPRGLKDSITANLSKQTSRSAPATSSQST